MRKRAISSTQSNTGIHRFTVDRIKGSAWLERSFLGTGSGRWNERDRVRPADSGLPVPGLDAWIRLGILIESHGRCTIKGVKWSNGSNDKADKIWSVVREREKLSWQQSQATLCCHDVLWADEKVTQPCSPASWLLQTDTEVNVYNLPLLVVKIPTCGITWKRMLCPVSPLICARAHSEEETKEEGGVCLSVFPRITDISLERKL